MAVRGSFGALVISTAVLACSDSGSSGATALAEIQASHIEANAPTQSEFDRVLRRDLEAYFGAGSATPIRAEFELLRDGPTQSGVAYPKWYAWVRVFEGAALLKEGAVRVAAIERERFEVTDFLTREEIAGDGQRIYSVFPVPVCQRIKQKMSQ